MSHENARKGISRVFFAEILSIITVVICAVLNIVIPDNGEEISDIVYIVLVIISTVIMVAGLNMAGKDNVLLKSAFTFAALQLIISVVITVFAIIPSLPEWIGNIGDFVVTIFGLIITHHVLYGCAELSPELKDKAYTTWNIYKVTIILDIVFIIAEVIMGIMGMTVDTSIVAVIVIIADALISLIAYIFYLSFLSKAKKVL